MVDGPHRGPGRPRQQGLAERRREQIVAAAYEVFAAQGYENTTTKDLATRAGLGEGTVYRYFDSKRDILDSVFDYAAERVMRAVSAGEDLAEPIGSLDEFAARLSSTVDRLMALLDEEPQLVKFFLVEAGAADEELKARVFGLSGMLVQTVSALLADGQDAGWVRDDVDTRQYGRIIVLLAMPAARHAVQGTLTQGWRDHFVLGVVRVIVAALRAPEPA